MHLYEGVLGRLPGSIKTKELRPPGPEGLAVKNYQLTLSQKMTQNSRLILSCSDTFETLSVWQQQPLPPRPEPNSDTPESSTGHQSLDQQVDALTAAGVESARVYSDKLGGTSTREQRPASPRSWTTPDEGDVVVVVGIDRLGRNAAEVMMTIRELGERNIVLRSLREGIDTSNATGRMVAGVLASLAELELELGRERRVRRERHVGHVASTSDGLRRLIEKKAALAQRMHTSGESASTIATALGVSRATVYRVLAEQTAEGD